MTHRDKKGKLGSGIFSPVDRLSFYASKVCEKIQEINKSFSPPLQNHPSASTVLSSILDESIWQINKRKLNNDIGVEEKSETPIKGTASVRGRGNRRKELNRASLYTEQRTKEWLQNRRLDLSGREKSGGI